MQSDQQAPTGDTSPHTPKEQQPNQTSENRQSSATDMQDETAPTTQDAPEETPTDDQSIEQSADDDTDNEDTVTEASMESFPASDPPAWRTYL